MSKSADAQIEAMNKGFPEFRPDQPRDAAGQWSGGGGSVLSSTDPQRDANFRAWFGDSKVVDEKGEPLVVYHATNADFTTFDIDKASGIAGAGVYVQDLPPDSDKYGTAVKPLYIKIENPVDFTSGTDAINDMGVSLGLQSLYTLPGIPQIKEWSKELRTRLIAAGYDGAELQGEDGARHFVAYHAENVKSAIGNTGDFDPKNPDITKGFPEFQPSQPRDSRGRWSANLESFLSGSEVQHTVFHGTGEVFDTFEQGFGSGNVWGEGHYFTDSREDAERWGKLTARGVPVAIVEAHISIKKPLYLEGDGGFGGEFHQMIPDGVRSELFQRFDPQYDSDVIDALSGEWVDQMEHERIAADIVTELKDMGYDGIIGQYAGNTHYVVFQSTQIKDINRNSGDFDPTNPDITKASTRAPWEWKAADNTANQPKEAAKRVEATVQQWAERYQRQTIRWLDPRVELTDAQVDDLDAFFDAMLEPMRRQLRPDLAPVILAGANEGARQLEARGAKGFPEFRYDQPRNADGEWSGGGGTPTGGWQQTMRGEYWLDGSWAQFADAAIGMGHEGFALDAAMRDVVAESDHEYDVGTDDGVDWDEFVKLQAETFAKENPDIVAEVGDDPADLIEEWATQNIDPELWDAANGRSKDIRLWAAARKGWIRLEGNNVQMVGISAGRLKDLADGLSDAFTSEDEDAYNSQSYDIEVVTVESADRFLKGEISAIESRVYRDVPIPVIEAANVAALREFDSQFKVSQSHTLNKGFPEYRPDQPRNERGEWAGGSGTSQIDSAEFKAWFGDSKVTNADGSPRVVWHGVKDTQALDPDNLEIIDGELVFRPSFDVFNTEGGIEAGVWFATDKKTAAQYGTPIPFYLRIENPTQTEGPIQTKPEGVDGVYRTRGKSDAIGDAWELAIFDPSQAKLALGNSGAFSRDDPSISKSAKREAYILAGLSPASAAVQATLDGLGESFDKTHGRASNLAPPSGVELTWHETSGGGKYWTQNKARRFRGADPEVQEVIQKTTLDFVGVTNQSALRRIKRILREGVAGQLSIEEIAEQIAADRSQLFSPERALLIARTELARAFVLGELLGYAQDDTVGSLWVLSEDPCPYCVALAPIWNAEPRPIGISFQQIIEDDLFEPEGLAPMDLSYRPILGPPLHPNCRCDLEVVDLPT